MEEIRKPPRKRKTMRYMQNVIATIILSMVALLSILFCIFLLLRSVTLERQRDEARKKLEAMSASSVYTQDQVDQMVKDNVESAKRDAQSGLRAQIQKSLQDGTSLLSTVRAVFLHSIIVPEENHYAFFDIDEEIEKNPFSAEDFVKEEGKRLQYVGEDAQVQPLTGVDVSQYQGDIDWEKVKNDSIDFAMVRAGLRKMRTGELTEDEKFRVNMDGALNAGLKVGVYFYSSAVNDAEAQEEADYLVGLLGPYHSKISYPVAIDMELPESDNARQVAVSREQFTKNAQIFCETVKKAGYEPMIYGNLKTFTMMLDVSQVNHYLTWIAYYSVPQYYPYRFSIWQYSAKGTVDGIPSEVDLNFHAAKN